MDKQEAIKKIKNISTLKINDTVSHHQIDMVIKNQVLDIISQINEPQKPVVPQCIDTWILCAECFGFNLYKTMTGDEMPDKVATWIADNPETFTKAWLFGYEVEKEKLYTAMLKISDEYLRLDCEGNFGHFKVDLKYILNGARAYQFTEDDLVKYHIWGNDNYDVKEAE
ncbi:hypothetical protein Si077_00862 [Streptococcus infantarius subsp. infantarius]|nr:hypothetical protein [Streptococcus infantarius subsp. infantarius]